MTSKTKIIETAKHRGFVDTDGDWCMTRNSEEFKTFLEKNFGFKIISCKPTETSTAIAQTVDGYIIAWNGYCTILKD